MNITPGQRWLICWLYAAVILGASILPGSAVEQALNLFPHQDKVLHILMYGGWAAALGWALQQSIRNRPVPWTVGIVLTATAYGTLMEGLQGSLPWIRRACSGADMLANGAGAILGARLCILLFARRRPGPTNVGCSPPETFSR